MMATNCFSFIFEQIITAFLKLTDVSEGRPYGSTCSTYHFAVVGGIFVNYLRRNQNDIGGGMGKDYMKEHWGIDDDK